MSEKIEPALSAEEWKAGRFGDQSQFVEISGVGDLDVANEDRYSGQVVDAVKVIALANAALPDSDPRKITREKILLVRSAIVHEPYAGSSSPNPDGAAALQAFADALESYLPPE
jgi:hypothetical protein